MYYNLNILGATVEIMTDTYFSFLDTYLFFLQTVQTALLLSTTLMPYQAPSRSTRVTREHGNFLAQTRDECYL